MLFTFLTGASLFVLEFIFCIFSSSFCIYLSSLVQLTVCKGSSPKLSAMWLMNGPLNFVLNSVGVEQFTISVTGGCQLQTIQTATENLLHFCSGGN